MCDHSKFEKRDSQITNNIFSLTPRARTVATATALHQDAVLNPWGIRLKEQIRAISLVSNRSQKAIKIRSNSQYGSSREAEFTFSNLRGSSFWPTLWLKHTKQAKTCATSTKSETAPQEEHCELIVYMDLPSGSYVVCPTLKMLKVVS